jgi:hypothetical protein
VVVDLAEHPGDVDIAFVERADGTYSCEGAAELFKDGRFGVGFEPFDLTGAGDVETCDLNTDC